MKDLLKITLVISMMILLGSNGFAQDNPWEKDFVLALQEGKLENQAPKGTGLGYTLTREEAEERVLAKAIKKAIKMEAPPCEAMKIAVDLKYKPFSVIKNVFGAGGEVDLNQMCMCATEKGVSTKIIAQAAREATFGGKPVFPPDEVTQAQCLGLPYTPVARLESIIPPPPPNPVSPSIPTQETTATPPVRPTTGPTEGNDA